MADYIFYWTYFRKETRELGRPTGHDWHTDDWRVLDKMRPRDNLWVIVRQGAQWKLEQRIRVRALRDEGRGAGFGIKRYRRYHAIGDPSRSKHFDVHNQPDLGLTLTRLQLASGHGISTRGTRIGQSLQSAKRLSPADVVLLRNYEAALSGDNLSSWEESEADWVQKRIDSDSSRSPTSKSQLIKARRGQGRFRSNVQRLERKCRLTRMTDSRLLVASHIKPWRNSSDRERLDGNNGLLLSPHVDKLFNDGWISFSDSGQLLCSNRRAIRALEAWGLPASAKVGAFSAAQRKYLMYHRENVFGKGTHLQPKPRNQHGAD